MLERFDLHDPADPASLITAERHLGHVLPEQYRAFIIAHDGGEGFIGEQYLILWRARELAELNDAYEVARYAPGLLLFGSNGGGEAFAFDVRNQLMKVVMVPFIGMSLADAIPVADSFDGLLSAMANGKLL